MIANKLCLLAKEKISHTNTLQTNAPEQIHIHKPYLENLHEFVNNNGQQNSQHNAMEPRFFINLKQGTVVLARPDRCMIKSGTGEMSHEICNRAWQIFIFTLIYNKQRKAGCLNEYS